MKKKISYIVGGYLRDSYLGYENFDVDIASSMSLDEMLSFFLPLSQRLFQKNYKSFLLKMTVLNMKLLVCVKI